MNPERKTRRREERKYKRIFVRYGAQKPEFQAVAIQLSTCGLFLSTNEMVYEKGSPIIIEIKTPTQTFLLSGVVRHAFKVHPHLARFTRPGMGVEFAAVSPEVRDFLASL